MQAVQQISLLAQRNPLLRLLLSCRAPPSGKGFSTEAKEVAVGVNYLKTGSDPELKPDEEYPDWLWELAEPEPTLFELRRKYEAGGKDIENMTLEEVARLIKLENRASIKGKNTIKGSSKI